MSVLSIILQLLQGLGVGIAASITVGPVAILCIQRTLSKGHRSGLASGLGIACADSLMAIVAYFFYSVMQTQIAEFDHILKVVGGVFVIGMGIYVFVQNPVPQIRRNKAGKTSLWQDFISIFGITIANFFVVIPYILAFFTVFKISSSESHNFASVFAGGVTLLGFFAGAAIWWTSLVLIMNLFRRKFKPRHLVILDRVAGIIIVILGVYTILTTFVKFGINGFL